jgi:hypothetical protein
MNWILLNMPMAVVAVLVAVGLPSWVTWRYPEQPDTEPALGRDLVATREGATRTKPDRPADPVVASPVVA